MNVQEWEEIAKVLLAAYPQAAIPVETLAVYANELQDLQAQSVMYGARLAMRECAFFPTIAEIRERAAAEETRYIHKLVDEELAKDAVERRLLESSGDLEEHKRRTEEGVQKIREILAEAKGPLANDLGQVAG